MNKIIMIAIFFIVILITGGYVFINKDRLFLFKVEISYPDGCIEEFHGTELITDECTDGRRIVEEQENGTFNEGNFNSNKRWNLSQIIID